MLAIGKQYFNNSFLELHITKKYFLLNFPQLNPKVLLLAKQIHKHTIKLFTAPLSPI